MRGRKIHIRVDEDMHKYQERRLYCPVEFWETDKTSKRIINHIKIEEIYDNASTMNDENIENKTARMKEVMKARKK